MPSIVTLTTDFGLRDSFVGAMKGVLLSRCPGVQIVDICHEVPAQDIRIGALRLASAASYFPPGTVHVAVVDPGVGSARRAIAVAAGGHRFVGPDNGVLSLAARRDATDWHAVEITNRAYLLEPISNTFHGRDVFAPGTAGTAGRAPTEAISNTFHGRDVFAPAAAFLACGGDISQLGGTISSVVGLPWSSPSVAGDTVRGIILDVDRFGNLITNIRLEDALTLTLSQRERGPAAALRVVSVEVGGIRISGLRTSYDPSQRVVALASSAGWLEVAAPGGDAATLLGVGVGAPVEVRLGPAEASTP